MPKVLIVDDDDKIREVIREYAEFQGYMVVEAKDGMEAVNICRTEDFDVMVMDIMMPRLDGFWACREIRKFKDIPVIMLSARGEEYDKLFGFELGIDDYMVKPFSPKELMSRLNVITRRNAAAVAGAAASVASAENAAQVAAEESGKLKFEGLEIDPAGRNVFVDGKKKDLTPKEFDLLMYLARNKNVVVSRDRLLNEVWGFEYYGDDRTVDTHIKMLRSSIGDYRKYIVTSRGAGYKFEIY